VRADETDEYQEVRPRKRSRLYALDQEYQAARPGAGNPASKAAGEARPNIQRKGPVTEKENDLSGQLDTCFPGDLSKISKSVILRKE
jgi:hypothetical protein